VETEKVNYQNIIKIKEVRMEHQVNQHIASGWKLLNILTKDSGDPRVKHQYSVYVLGWDVTTANKKCREWDENGWEIKDPLKEYRDGVPTEEDNSLGF
jgi:hypothetical protein